MGFKFAAFFAGRNPKITPIATETVNATTIALTEGVTVMSNSLPAAEESKNFSELFDIDIIADTDYMYVISGTKKQNTLSD